MLKITHFHLEKNKNSYCKIFNSLYFPFDSTQKSNYILEFINFFEALEDRIPTRDELLQIKGIGPETADSILLFAFNQAQFKVDAYTKRMLLHNNLIAENAKYNEIKYFMEEEIKKEIKEEVELIIVYQEYHALIVNHAKQYYSKKPYGEGCFLTNQKL